MKAHIFNLFDNVYFSFVLLYVFLCDPLWLIVFGFTTKVLKGYH
jgi:hypothetical protein